MVIGNQGSQRNGENWLWWSTYPYLGSLSGGSLSVLSEDITEFTDIIQNSLFVSGSCDPSISGYRCAPFKTEVNDSNSIFRRINRGQDLDTGTNTSVSNGVPFNHSELNQTSRSSSGSFDGGIDDYLVITVIEESSGNVGFYHGNKTEQQLYTDPFTLDGPGWDSQNVKEPSNRFIHDYESYLKVWSEIQDLSGETNTYVYTVPNGDSRNNAFQMHNIASYLGETVTQQEFLDEFGESIQSVGSQNLNLSALTHSNVYSALTSTVAYQYYLSESEQNGAGLKNFGVIIDPSLANYEEYTTIVALGISLDYFLKDGFIYFGTCYEFYKEDLTITPIITLDADDIVKNVCSNQHCANLCPSPTPSVTPSNTPTPSITPSITPTTTVTQTNTPSITPTKTPPSTVNRK